MRKIAPLIVSLLCLLLPVPLLAAESTRTLKVELSAGAAGRFRVENLAGSMRVVPATGGKVLAVATIHAESDSLAEAMRFEEVSDPSGVPTLRVIYPLDSHDTIRYDSRHPEGALSGLFGGGSTSTKYDGHRVKISSSQGVLIYADVEVQVPPAAGREATFRNEVGKLVAEWVEGKLRFDSSSGDIVLERLKGDIRADTGSGDVKAEDLTGSFSCDTGSGDCSLSGLE